MTFRCEIMPFVLDVLKIVRVGIALQRIVFGHYDYIVGKLNGSLVNSRSIINKL